MDILPTEACHEEAFLLDVLTFARRYARQSLPRDKAEDLAQDIVLECLAMLRSAKDRPAIRRLPNFVRRIVRARAIDAHRRNYSRLVSDAEHARDLAISVHAWMSPDHGIEQEELENFHARTLASLPYKCRSVYLMVREQEGSYQAVADMLGFSRAYVNKYMVEANRLLRSQLIAEDMMHPAEPEAGASTSRASGEPEGTR